MSLSCLMTPTTSSVTDLTSASGAVDCAATVWTTSAVAAQRMDRMVWLIGTQYEFHSKGARRTKARPETGCREARGPRLCQLTLVPRRGAAQTVARQTLIHHPLGRASLDRRDATLGPGATGCVRIVGYRRSRRPDNRRWLRIRRGHFRSDRSHCEQGGGAKGGKDRLHMILRSWTRLHSLPCRSRAYALCQACRLHALKNIQDLGCLRRDRSPRGSGPAPGYCPRCL